MRTISNNTTSMDAVTHAIHGGKFFLRKDSEGFIEVLDDAGNVIGSARLYHDGCGYAIHTGPYAGYASLDQIEFIS